MSQRYQLDDGIVIRRLALPNGDVVVTLFGQTGKWRGIVKKAQRLGGNPGRLSLFHDVTVQTYRRKEDDLAVITQVQLNGALPKLSSPQIYPFAHVLAELIDQLSVDVHVGEALYGYLASALRGLNEHHDPECIALIYCWKFLQQAGLAPRVTRCAICSDTQLSPYFDVSAGGLTCLDCARGLRLSETTASELRQIHSSTVRDAISLTYSKRAEHWLLLSRYLSYHVGQLRSLASVMQLSRYPGETTDA